MTDDARLNRIERLAEDADRRSQRLEERVDVASKYLTQRMDDFDDRINQGMRALDRKVDNAIATLDKGIREIINGRIKVVEARYSWVRVIVLAFVLSVIAMGGAAWLSDKWGRPLFGPISGPPK